MLKHAILAAASFAALTVSAIPVVTITTTPALAQACIRSPNCPGTPSGSSYDCTTELGHLFRVYEEELEESDNPNYVVVRPICIGEDYGVFRNDGNVGTLRNVIADNSAMMEALFENGDFDPEDVIGIRLIGEGKVILYVHEFH